jgi:transcriptional regulator with XRE-family HTH domain
MSEPAFPAGGPEWDVADRLRKALRHADLGVTEIADYLGVSRTSVSNWINGRVDPSTQTLRLWALKTGVAYEWLAGDRDFRRRGSLSALMYTFTPDPFPFALAA